MTTTYTYLQSRIAGPAKFVDSSAFSQMSELCRPRAMMLARRILGDEQAAEDAVQEAFLAAFRRVGELEDAAGFENWLLEFVRLCSLHALAIRNRRRSVEVREHVDEYDFEAGLLDRLLADGIYITVGQVREDLRQILWLFYGERLSLAQIGSQLNLSVEAAGERLYRARVYARQRFAAPNSEWDRAGTAALGAGLAGAVHTHVAVTTYTLGFDAGSSLATSVQTTTYLYDIVSPKEVDTRGIKSGPSSVTFSHDANSRITTMIA